MKRDSALTINLSDPIADMLTRLRNACRAKKEKVAFPLSRLRLEIIKVLKDEGFIKGFGIQRERGLSVLNVLLRYDEKNQCIITGIRRISKPGRRVYVKREEIPKVMSGMGLAILSTSRGIMTGEEARRRGLGGEVLCHVW